MKKNKDGECKRINGRYIKWNELDGMWIYQHDEEEQQEQEMDKAFDFLVHELRVTETLIDLYKKEGKYIDIEHELQGMEELNYDYLKKVEESL